MRKTFTSMFAVVALFLSFASLACGTSACNPPPVPPSPACGPTGCSQTDGNMWLSMVSESEAWGDKVLAASGGNYNFTTVFGTELGDKPDYVNLNGGFMSLSEGTDWTEAGGQSDAWAGWSKYYEW